MPSELHDFQDLIRFLRHHPDWREELRALLLTQELLALPALVWELTETMAHLTEGQQRLTEGQEWLTARVDQLTESQQRLTEGQQRLENQRGEVWGWTLEQRYRTHA